MLTGLLLTNFFMKNFLLSLCALYGVSVSVVSAYGFFLLDMPALENAVAVGNENAELRHRLNVAAEGNWILTGNLITVISLSQIRRSSRRRDSKDD